MAHSPSGDLNPRNISLIRHGESTNNWLYREAHRLFPADSSAAASYVYANRSPDPFLSSDVGVPQASLLGAYLGPALSDQDVLVVSPMRRALATIAPTVAAAAKAGKPVHLLVDAEYYEMGGLYVASGAAGADGSFLGLNMSEITSLLNPENDALIDIQFVAFRTGFESDGLGWHDGRREQYPSTFARVNRFLVRFLDLCALIPPKATLYCVGHGEFTSFFLSILLSASCGNHSLSPTPDGGGSPRPPLPFGGFVKPNSSITTLVALANDTFLCTGVGTVPHLVPPPTSPSPLLSGGDPIIDGWQDCLRHPPDESPTAHFFHGRENVPHHLWASVQALREVYLRAQETWGMSDDSKQAQALSAKDDASNTHLLLLLGGRVVAYGQLQIVRSPQASQCSGGSEEGGEEASGGELSAAANVLGRFRQVVVVTRGRGKGWGALLLSALSERAKAAGCSDTVVHAWVKSRGFYERFGFGEKEGSRGTYSSDGVDCVKLWKKI